MTIFKKKDCLTGFFPIFLYHFSAKGSRFCDINANCILICNRFMTLYVRKHDPLKCKEWKICCQDWTYVEIWFSEPSKNASQHRIIAISDGKIHVEMDDILVYIYVSSCQDEPCVSLFDRYCIHLFICSSIHQSWHRWPFRSPCQDWCLSFALAIPLPPPHSHTTPSLASHITHILTPPAPLHLHQMDWSRYFQLPKPTIYLAKMGHIISLSPFNKTDKQINK